MKAKTLRIANTCCCLPECVFVIYIICQGASELRRSSFFTMRRKWGAQIEKMKYFAGRCFIWSERKGWGWCREGIKGKMQDRQLYVGVNIIWRSDRNQPCFTYLSLWCEMCLLLTALKMPLPLDVCLRAGCIYMHICVPMTSPKKKTCKCTGVYLCVRIRTNR